MFKFAFIHANHGILDVKLDGTLGALPGTLTSSDVNLGNKMSI